MCRSNTFFLYLLSRHHTEIILIFHGKYTLGSRDNQHVQIEDETKAVRAQFFSWKYLKCLF